MLTKTKLIKQIEKFPEEFSIDELVERLVLIEVTETNQPKGGEVISEAGENLDPVQKQILSFAGPFADMDQKNYNSFVKEIENTCLNLIDRDVKL